jgi:hypothetical protein
MRLGVCRSRFLQFPQLVCLPRLAEGWHRRGDRAALTLVSHTLAPSDAGLVLKALMPSDPTRGNTIPFQILVDSRTVAIANALLQQVTQSVYGTANVTALKPAVVKSHFYGSLVNWVYESPERQKELIRFYRDEWCGLPLQKRKHSMPVRWYVSVNEALIEIAKQFPYKHLTRGNKSLTFCVLIAFAAKYRYGMPIPEA